MLIYIFFIFPALSSIHPAEKKLYKNTIIECSLENRLKITHKPHLYTQLSQIDKKIIGTIKGWLNSVTGMVKNYIKSRFSTDPQCSKDAEKLKSLATVSPMRSTITTNPFAQSPPIMAMKTAPTHAMQNMYERHRSPDPPPRATRGNQSPLILRRKLELASSSPLMQKRFGDCVMNIKDFCSNSRLILDSCQHLHRLRIFHREDCGHTTATACPVHRSIFTRASTTHLSHSVGSSVNWIHE